jgi:hypothetical protein
VGTPDELEKFRERLSKHRILEIRLLDLEKDLWFDSLVSVLTTQTGPNFVSYLVFYEGKLIACPDKPENFYQKEATRIYISDLFGSLFSTGIRRGADTAW